MQSHNTTSFHLFPTPPSSPAFLYSEGALTSHIVHTLLTPKLRCSLCSAGLKPTQYSGHSFRCGEPTYTFCCGVLVELISLQGDWSSYAVELYIAQLLARCISVPHFIARNTVSLSPWFLPWHLHFYSTFYFFTSFLLSGGLGGPHWGEQPHSCLPLDVAFLVPANNKDHLYTVFFRL